MARKEIRFAGFGGQGLVLSGIILGRTAAIYEDLQASQTQSYGAEARGGASRCDVVIDDTEITFIGVKAPDIFVVMSQEAYERYIGTVKRGGIVYYDADLVKANELEGIRQIPLPATKMASESFGNRIVANIVMLGAMVEGTQLLDLEEMRRCLEESVPDGTQELNLKAFDLGRSLALRIKGRDKK
jgi:2-oxoglutarate ferredoxin oxidoreductase subunit gamma